MLCATLALAGCESASSTSSGPVYQTSQTGQVISGESGMVIAVEEVIIQAASSAAGSTGTGAQVGSAVGSAVLGGNPASIGRAIGSIVGSKAGASLDNNTGDKITILLDSGKTVTIIQVRDKKGQPMMSGERVVVEQSGGTSTSGGGNARVVRESPSNDPDYSKPIGTLN